MPAARRASGNLCGFLLFSFLLFHNGTTLAGGSSERDGRDSLLEESFLARTADRLSIFGWMRGGGGAGGANSSVCSDVEFESQCRKLEPCFGSIIDTIVVAGNTRTKAFAILREMATKQGTPLDERLIRRDSAYLRGLGYFVEVVMSAEITRSGYCRLLVTVRERPSLFMRVPYPVVNYDFKEGLSYGLSWKIKNYRGSFQDISLSAIMKRDESEGASFSWNVPWFTGRRIRFRLDGFAYRRLKEPLDRDEDYVRAQSGGNVGLGFPLTRSLVKQLWFKTSLSFEARDARLTFSNNHGADFSTYYNQNFLAVGAELEYDSRSDRLSPFNGMVHRFRIRRFTSISGPNQQYVFYGFSNYFYLPVGVERSFIFAINGDFREGDVPSFFQMKLGGVRDLRGFSDEDLRGTAKMVGTVEYRARLIGSHVFKIPKIGDFDFTMNGVLFLDNGTLTNSILDLGTSTVYTTGGLGVEILSPLRDMIRLEVASHGTGHPAFYMTAGSNF